MLESASGRSNKPTTTDDARELDAKRFRLDDALGFLSRRMNSLASAIFTEESDQTDVTAMQMGVLLTVYQADLISLRDLARQMHVDRSTLQELVKRMVNRGLLHRRNPAHDKRTHELWLTAEGIEHVRRYLHAMSRVQVRLFEGISEEDQKVILRVTKAILKHHDY
jgi:DNA-binding MarR family transcriptional regulator